jgi:hypothetical protein
VSVSETATIRFDLNDKFDACHVFALGRSLVTIVNGEPSLPAGVQLLQGTFGDAIRVGSCAVIGPNRVVIEVQDVPVELAIAEGYVGPGPHRPRMTEAWATAVEHNHAVP